MKLAPTSELMWQKLSSDSVFYPEIFLYAATESFGQEGIVPKIVYTGKRIIFEGGGSAEKDVVIFEIGSSLCYVDTSCCYVLGVEEEELGMLMQIAEMHKLDSFLEGRRMLKDVKYNLAWARASFQRGSINPDILSLLMCERIITSGISTDREPEYTFSSARAGNDTYILVECYPTLDKVVEMAEERPKPLIDKGSVTDWASWREWYTANQLQLSAMVEAEEEDNKRKAALISEKVSDCINIIGPRERVIAIEGRIYELLSEGIISPGSLKSSSIYSEGKELKRHETIKGVSYLLA